MYKFATVLFLLLATTLQVIAEACTCASRQYAHEDVMAGIAQGNETNPNPTSERGPYPHRFGNREGIEMPFCDSEQFIEFPLMQGGPYTGGPPGADRVIYSVENEFCGCITHSGAERKNGFVSCTYDNPPELTELSYWQLLRTYLKGLLEGTLFVPPENMAPL